MPLLTITDPEKILADAEDGPQGLPVVRLPETGITRCLLKLRQTRACCEVLGYLLAPSLRVPVMRATPLWCPRAFRYKGQPAGDGRIGLAVQYMDEFQHITWEQATSQAPEIVAGSLALCLLDRYEWGQFALTASGLVFYDLERLFPALRAERLPGQTWDDVAVELAEVADSFRSEATSIASNVIDEAVRLGVAELFRLAVGNASTISHIEFIRLFDIHPHPLAEQIAAIAADVAVEQFRYASQVLRITG